MPNDSEVLVAVLDVPTGSYTLLAKTTLVQTSRFNGGGRIIAALATRCTVNGVSSTNRVATDDYAETELGRGDAEESGRATLTTAITATYPQPATVTLRCFRKNNRDDTTEQVARETKIIATKVDSVTRTAYVVPATP